MHDSPALWHLWWPDKLKLLDFHSINYSYHKTSGQHHASWDINIDKKNVLEVKLFAAFSVLREQHLTPRTTIRFHKITWKKISLDFFFCTFPYDFIFCSLSVMATPSSLSCTCWSLTFTCSEFFFKFLLFTNFFFYYFLLCKLHWLCFSFFFFSFPFPSSAFFSWGLSLSYLLSAENTALQVMDRNITGTLPLDFPKP